MNRKKRPLYMIGVASKLAGVHPQTLRIYERKRLVVPKRTAKNTRLYSDEDIERLKEIQELTQKCGINLAGVERIMNLRCEIENLERKVARLQAEMEKVRREMEERLEAVRRESRHEIVLVRRGIVMKREE